MSRARNRADGDFGDLDITNIGAVSLDSIKGDTDANTSIAFSGSDVITFTTNSSTAATFNASQILTLVVILLFQMVAKLVLYRIQMLYLSVLMEMLL